MRQARTLILLGACVAPSAVLADEVFFVDSQGNQRRRTGEILDYRGGRVTLRSRGREISIPSLRIQRIDAEWTAPHQQGDAEFAARDYGAALDSYLTAWKQEHRAWVKDKLLARIIWCERNTYRIADACRNFAKLFHDDGDTPYFAAIPLAWRTGQPQGAVRQLAQGWLGSENGSVKRLIAASWLLSTGNRSAAMRTLRQLADHPRQEIAGLARIQFWRTRIVSVTERDVDRWRQEVERLPGRLRAGPYFVLGQAYARIQHTDRAALAFLRVPTLFASHQGLSQAALYAAGRAVEDGGNRAEAILLYRQAVELDADSLEGQQAGARLTELNH